MILMNGFCDSWFNYSWVEGLRVQNVILDFWCEYCSKNDIINLENLHIQ